MHSAFAVLATLSASRTEHLLADGSPAAEALTSGFHMAFWIGAVLVIAALAVAALVLNRSRPDRLAGNAGRSG